MLKYVCLLLEERFDASQPMCVRLYYLILKNTARIVELIGDVPRIELFARQATPGWDVWGNEIQSDIEMKSEEEIE